MKNIISTSLTILIALLLSSPALAVKRASDGQLLHQCKLMVKNEFKHIKHIRLTHLRRNLKNFKAKLNVATEDRRFLLLCTIDKNQAAALAILNTKKPSAVLSSTADI